MEIRFVMFITKAKRWIMGQDMETGKVNQLLITDRSKEVKALNDMISSLRWQVGNAERNLQKILDNNNEADVGALCLSLIKNVRVDLDEMEKISKSG